MFEHQHMQINKYASNFKQLEVVGRAQLQMSENIFF